MFKNINSFEACKRKKSVILDLVRQDFESIFCHCLKVNRVFTFQIIGQDMFIRVMLLGRNVSLTWDTKGMVKPFDLKFEPVLSNKPTTTYNMSFFNLTMTMCSLTFEVNLKYLGFNNITGTFVLVCWDFLPVILPLTASPSPTIPLLVFKSHL